MMGYLYGELSESEQAAFRAKLERDPALEAEVAALDRTRKAFGQLPVEEPPPAISAQLLHEAAKRAPAKMRAQTVEGRPGIWERVRAWFEPLMAHPAAASVAALLLVGGAAGLFYMRGIDGDVHPTAPSAAPPPATAAATAPAAADPAGVAVVDSTLATPGYLAKTDKLVLDEAEDSGLRGANAEGFEAQLAAPEQELALRERERAAKESQVYRAAPEKPEPMAARNKRAASKKRSLDDDLPMANAVSGADPLIVPDQKNEGAGRGGVDGRFALGGSAGPTSTGSSTSTVTGGVKAPAPSADEWKQTENRRDDGKDVAVARQAPARAEAMPPAAPPYDGDDDAAADEEVAQIATQQQGESTYRVYKDKRSDEAAKSLHGKLNRALDGKQAKKSRCEDAARIANDILDRNPAYYHAKVEESKRLSACRWYVAEETRSRKARRAQKSSAKSSAPAQPAEADSARTTVE